MSKHITNQYELELFYYGKYDKTMIKIITISGCRNLDIICVTNNNKLTSVSDYIYYYYVKLISKLPFYTCNNLNIIHIDDNSKPITLPYDIFTQKALLSSLQDFILLNKLYNITTCFF